MKLKCTLPLCCVNTTILCGLLFADKNGARSSATQGPSLRGRLGTVSIMGDATSLRIHALQFAMGKRYLFFRHKKFVQL